MNEGGEELPSKPAISGYYAISDHDTNRKKDNKRACSVLSPLEEKLQRELSENISNLLTDDVKKWYLN